MSYSTMYLHLIDECNMTHDNAVQTLQRYNIAVRVIDKVMKLRSPHTDEEKKRFGVHLSRGEGFAPCSLA